MSTSAQPNQSGELSIGHSLLPLEAGDRLDQKTFHARYEAMPEDVKAELIGGVVYVQSPVRRRHGRAHAHIITWLGMYEIATPGPRFFLRAIHVFRVLVFRDVPLGFINK